MLCLEWHSGLSFHGTRDLFATCHTKVTGRRTAEANAGGLWGRVPQQVQGKYPEGICRWGMVF